MTEPAKKERPVRPAIYNSGKPVPVVYEPDAPDAAYREKLGAMRTFNTPIKMEGTWGAAPAPPPLMGEHTEEALREVLDLGDEDIARLKERGAI